MGIEQLFPVYLRRPRLKEADDRADHFWEFGGFECTGCHARHIRAEAGSVKTEASQRKVPLHPQVIDEGFLGFVESIKEGPLFYDRRRRKPGAKKPAQKIVAKNVAAWVHRLGLDVGLQHRKGPSHAWRHLFRTTARELGIEEEVIEAIIGHAAKTVGRAGCVACDG